MIVVSDSSPLAYLHQIVRSHFLKDLYGRLVVPPAVDAELHRAPELDRGFDWELLEVIAPSDAARVEELCLKLYPGESEATALAIEIRAGLLLIDELDGREVAQELGLSQIGLLGVFLDAKSRGFVDSVSRELDKLVSSTNFRVKASLREELLRLAGEG